MAFTAYPVDGKNVGAGVPPLRLPLGNRFLSIFEVEEVTSTGSSVDLTAYGVGFIDCVLPCNTEVVGSGIQISKNSITLSETEDDPGKFFIDGPTANGDDIVVLVIYSPR